MKPMRENVAKALTEKHPCLREPGSSHAWYCWKFSLSFKMCNLRQKYRIAGCPELTVNQKNSTSRNQKLKKRSEMNFLPGIPGGSTPESLESERIALLDEMKKRKKDEKMIDNLMERTFALRRKEIVDGEPPVSEIKDRWPAKVTILLVICSTNLFVKPYVLTLKDTVASVILCYNVV